MKLDFVMKTIAPTGVLLNLLNNKDLELLSDSPKFLGVDYFFLPVEYMPKHNPILNSKINVLNPLVLDDFLVRSDPDVRSSISFKVSGLDTIANDVDHLFIDQFRSFIIDLGLYILEEDIPSYSELRFDGIMTRTQFLHCFPNKYISNNFEESPFKDIIPSSSIIDFQVASEEILHNSYK